MNTIEEEFHSIRALSLMIKLALFEQRYYEASVLMHERTMRIDRWTAMDVSRSEHENLVHLTLFDTVELERLIGEHTHRVEESLRAFMGTADARKAYSVAQFMANGS